MLSAAQLQIRNGFRQNGSIEPSGASAAIQHAEEVAKVLRQNVVQGKKTEEGQDTYSTSDTLQPCTCHGQRPDDADNNLRAADTRAHGARRQRVYPYGWKGQYSGRWLLRRRRSIRIRGVSPIVQACNITVMIPSRIMPQMIIISVSLFESN